MHDIQAVTGAGSSRDISLFPGRISALNNTATRERYSYGTAALCIAAMLLMLLGACSDSSDHAALAIPEEFAVGVTSRTFVDDSRSTPAHGPAAATNSRTLPTTIVYPALGTAGEPAVLDAPVFSNAPSFPLVLLSHGFGGSVEYLLPLAEAWASRGYVVALPRFPLTSNETPGGPVVEDTQNQPADVTFIIDELLAESNRSGELLSNALDGETIAAGGHSNGGITTYGLVANSCCRDRRIDAAIVLSGATQPFAAGEYDLSDMPPTFVVQGAEDVIINYNEAVTTYNLLHPPKAFLSLETADHGSYLAAENTDFPVVAQATLDFLNTVLREDSAAEERLLGQQVPGVAATYWAPDEASNVPVEKIPEPETNRQAFLSADSGLTDGQVITVTWSGFLPGKVMSALQCSGDGSGGAAACNISGGKILQPDPEGMGSLELVIRTGPVGNGVCDSANPCVVQVNDANLTEPEATIVIPIYLAD